MRTNRANSPGKSGDPLRSTLSLPVSPRRARAARSLGAERSQEGSTGPRRSEGPELTWIAPEPGPWTAKVSRHRSRATGDLGAVAPRGGSIRHCRWLAARREAGGTFAQWGRLEPTLDGF